jgi:hypothetical protein
MTRKIKSFAAPGGVPLHDKVSGLTTSCQYVRMLRVLFTNLTLD